MEVSGGVFYSLEEDTVSVSYICLLIFHIHTITNDCQLEGYFNTRTKHAFTCTGRDKTKT